jgi:hypothetical protein
MTDSVQEPLGSAPGCVYPYIIASYLYDFFSPKMFKKKIEEAARSLSKFRETTSFQALAFRGMSGALLAPAISIEIGCSLIFVRKGEATHSIYQVEGLYSAKYVFVDEFIGTGSTFGTVVESISKYSSDSECVGWYLSEKTIDFHSETLKTCKWWPKNAKFVPHIYLG